MEQPDGALYQVMCIQSNFYLWMEEDLRSQESFVTHVHRKFLEEEK